jgi:hypothetical protein
MRSAKYLMGMVELLDVGTTLLAIALTSESFFSTAFLAGLEVKGVTLDLFNNVFLLNLALEPAESAFQRFAVLQHYFCQTNSPPSGNK